MRIKELLKGVKVLQFIGDEQAEVTHITQDSREVTSGALFFAIKGANRDGHSFIPAVIAQKATVILCQQLPKELPLGVTFVQVADSNLAMAQVASLFYGNPSAKLKLVGVTGTNGKTTITTLLYQFFRQMGYKVGLISTIAIYVEEQKQETKNTTPDVLTLNKVLHQMVQARVSYCFMEVSSHGIALQRIAGLTFAGGVFTNLTQDHLDFHSTFAQYRDAKKKFFDLLPKEAFALTNVDDRNGLFMLQNTKAHKHTYSLESVADFKLRIVENTFSGLLVRIEGQEVATQLIGQFNAYNLLAIYATAVLLGAERDTVLKHLSLLKAVAGRFQYFVSPKGITVVVDYAHTPDALQNVLETLKKIKKAGQQLITLVGCGGNRDKGKRPMMARIAVSMSDKVVLTSDNPREEEPLEILREMEAGIDPIYKERYTVIEDRRAGIAYACRLAQGGDIVLLAGKGHETYQEIKGQRTHFDDLEEAKIIIND